MKTVVVRACAKINLELRILGRRGDGYHELRTTFQSLALHDTLTLRRTRGPFTIESNARDIPLDETNLIWRAAQALWSASGRRSEVRGATVHVRKRIPAGAGLGGGSSDAAATLVGLATVWNLRIGFERLHEVAASLGSDVPFFLLGATALGLGRGEVLYPLPVLPSTPVVLVHPHFAVSTADAYRWYAARDPRDVRPTGQQISLPLHPAGLAVVNDLESVVMSRYPAIARVRRALLASGASVAMMSGSGSTVFGLFATSAAARAAADRMAARGRTVTLTRTLGRAARPQARWISE
jgi:4-diphosphocytidyl-2-C-methyl-D-erythritol kinase